MLRFVVIGFLIAYTRAISGTAIDGGFSNCHCDDEGLWSVQNILECQKVGDFLIAIAYFSIPIELLYFVSRSNVPFKLVFLEFTAFIVLCGLTHLLNGWTYYGPHSFRVMMALTVAKLLTALVSCATSITLLTLFPLLLRVKVRERFLQQNVLELGQEVGMMKKQKETGWHIRMLTQEIRKSLDKHTILYTTLVELSNTLNLQNCAVWMLDDRKIEMNLTHELRLSSFKSYYPSIPMSDPDVLEITKNKGVRILRADSVLAIRSTSSSGNSGSVAAIRMPMLRASNFKGGTPELVDTCYAILVLVLPDTSERYWNYEEMEIIEVVADQVAVALSHAAILEESQMMRQKLEERNRILQQAKENAMMASQARNSFQKVMSYGMRRPMHSILGLISILQDSSLSTTQSFIVDTIMKTSNVSSALINDVMEISAKDNGKLLLEIKPFRLRSMVKEASCLVKCFCVQQGFTFTTDVQSSLPDEVMGDETRTFQVLLDTVGHLLDVSEEGFCVFFRVSLENSNDGTDLKMWGAKNINDDYINVKFEIEIRDQGFRIDGSVSTIDFGHRRHGVIKMKEGTSLSMCRKLVQIMQGSIRMSSDSQGRIQSTSLILRFQIQPPLFKSSSFDSRTLYDQSQSNSTFAGLHILLADDDNINRMVTKKLLEKLGFLVFAVSTGLECLSSIAGRSSIPFHIVVLDLHMPDMDGLEVAKRIKKSRSLNVPLILGLTASAEENVLERCLQVGMNGVIRKPVILRGLANELRAVLQRAGDW